MSPKAISYIRFSSGAQGKGSTTERQEALINQWVKSKGIPLSSLSESDLGVSAFSGANLNQGLGRIIDAINSGKIVRGDYILVEAVDRLGRQKFTQLFQMVMGILSAGVNIVTLQDGMEYSEDSVNQDGGSAVYILVAMAVQAHQYSNILSKRILAAYSAKRAKARKGEPIRVLSPFWISPDGKLIPRRAEIVRKCIELYLKGYGHRGIILELSGEYPEIKDTHPRTVKRWLSHRALIGEWPNKGDPIPGVFERLISEDEFLLLQSAAHRRKRKMGPEQAYPISGIVECDQCGRRFHYRRQKGRGYTIVYANCANYLQRGEVKCENNTSWPYEALYAIFLIGLEFGLSSVVLGKARDERADKIAALKQTKSDVDKQLAYFIDTVVDNFPDQELVKVKMASLLAEQQKISDKINSLEYQVSTGSGTKEAMLMEQILDAHSHREALLDDPIALREALLNGPFRIKVSFREAEIRGDLRDMKFTLLRRSTRHNCYLIRLEMPGVELENWDNTFSVYESNDEHIAVDRHGIRARGKSEDALLAALENQKGLRYEVRFSDRPDPLTPDFNLKE